MRFHSVLFHVGSHRTVPALFEIFMSRYKKRSSSVPNKFSKRWRTVPESSIGYAGMRKSSDVRLKLVLDMNASRMDVVRSLRHLGQPMAMTSIDLCGIEDMMTFTHPFTSSGVVSESHAIWTSKFPWT
jgi:hypothetical protein